MNQIVKWGLRSVRRMVVAVVGSTIVAFGLALLVLPGPAFVVIPIGLGILAIEFEWARRWLKRARETVQGATRRGPAPSAAPRDPPPDSSYE